jgi:hypothetical protein
VVENRDSAKRRRSAHTSGQLSQEEVPLIAGPAGEQFNSVLFPNSEGPRARGPDGATHTERKISTWPATLARLEFPTAEDPLVCFDHCISGNGERIRVSSVDALYRAMKERATIGSAGNVPLPVAIAAGIKQSRVSSARAAAQAPRRTTLAWHAQCQTFVADEFGKARHRLTYSALARLIQPKLAEVGFSVALRTVRRYLATSAAEGQPISRR